MNIKTFIRKLILGYSIEQEYLCTSLIDGSDQLRVFLTTQFSENPIDISNSHILLGYKPVILGVGNQKEEDFGKDELVCLSFVMNNLSVDLRWKGFPTASNCVARMILRRDREIVLGNCKLYLFKGVFAEHKFLSQFHQTTNRLLEGLKQKSGNIVLSGNLYEQVKVAYSIKRQISIVTLGVDDLYNMFPTDLHGPIGDEIYVGSLRHSGKACSQVQERKSICLSSVDLSWCKLAYELGKNHVNKLHNLRLTDLSLNRSALLSLPLPASVIDYKELKWSSFHDIGIHRIFIFDLLSKKNMRPDASPLAHIHREYAQWRNNANLSNEYLLR